MIIELENVSKGFGAESVLESISVRIDPNQRIGFIGTNGSGKTTMLNIINGDLDADSGSVHRGLGVRIGYLRQNSGLDNTNTIGEEMYSVFAKLLEIQETMRELELEMGELSPESYEYNEIGTRYSLLQSQFEVGEGYAIKAKIATVLNGMGFKGISWETPINILSGGERTRLAICKLLLEDPELLILDEPTNHLDFPTLMWLEDYLREYKGGLLVVSHDRFFLDRLCNIIWEIEHKTLDIYKGNYSQYLTLKEERFEQQQVLYQRQQEEIAKLEDYVARNIARASTSKMAQSRQNTLDRMERIPRPMSPPRPPNINFQVRRNPVNDVLEMEEVSLSVGEGEKKKHLFDDFNLKMYRGEKFALVGHNGIGKSSLLRAAQKKIPIDSGRIIWGNNVDLAYFEQGEGEMDRNKTVIQELWDDFPMEIEHTIRSTLGHAGITGEEVFKQVGNLSGGERARLKFAKLMLKEGNVLLLDEPTNHLDLATKEVLDSALEKFEGTLLVVSHDRYLLNKFPDKIVEMTETGAIIYDGNYDYYAKKKHEQREKENQKLQQAEQAEKEKKPTPVYRTREDRRLDAERRREFAFLEDEIMRLEEEVEQLEKDIANPEVMKDYDLLQEKCTLFDEKKAKLNEDLSRWATLGQIMDS